jgi:mRNA-degrading endonuclease RelE of RelBE toxin-antitoxin system
MTYRLLIDYQALDLLARLKKPVQRLIHKRLRQIQDFPFQMGRI